MLGAGASNPYGFPLGRDLKEYMSKRLKGFYNTLPKVKDVDPYKVMRALDRSSGPTIDQCIAYLAPEQRPVAQNIMVRALSCAEAELREKVEPWADWYPEFFDLIDIVNRQPPMKIVTFNYDRSLDWFFEEFPKYNTPHEARLEIAERIRAIEIIRPHGWMGPLKEISFGQVETQSAVQDAASNVLLISEAKQNSPEFERAYEAIRWAEQLVFIGFAFEATTIDKLLRGVTRNEATRGVWTTLVELRPGKREELYAIFPRRLSIPASSGQRLAVDLIKQLKAASISGKPC